MLSNVFPVPYSTIFYQLWIWIDLLPASEQWIVAPLGLTGIYGLETLWECRGVKFIAKCPAVRLCVTHAYVHITMWKLTSGCTLPMMALRHCVTRVVSESQGSGNQPISRKHKRYGGHFEWSNCMECIFKLCIVHYTIYSFYLSDNEYMKDKSRL